MTTTNTITKKIPNDYFVEKTDYSLWRLKVDHGRQTWHHLENKEEIENWPQTICDKYWMTSEGMLMCGTNGVQVWDTAFTAQAIIDIGLADEALNHKSMIKALEFLDDAQIKRDPIDMKECYRFQAKGAWGFSTRDQGYTVSDCASEALKSVIYLQKLGPDAMAALGKYCHNLEELSLKKEIACSGEILLSIVKNCPKLFKLEIEGKDYNNQTLYKILEHCPNILTLNINQCMNITDELLIATYKLCTNLKKLSFKKIFEITENFVISTLNHFPRTSTIVISNIDRMFQSSIEVDGEKIFLVANLCDVDIHRIIDFYSIKEDGLQELTFIDVKLDKSLLNFICVELNGLSVLELYGISGLSKMDIMNALENLKDLQIFTVKFSSVDHEAFFENDKEQLVKYCPKLKAIKWHFQKIYIKDNNHVLK
ncbi:12025_t:CDS:2 [Entrophospora sp. SA101]|nr:12025_t:CDS:2 [Entrophospora sp. SA101]